MTIQEVSPRPHAAAAGGSDALSVFDQAARIYDGWVDPDTGLCVLRIYRRGPGSSSGSDPASLGDAWSTLYHQYPCFLDGGRRVVLQRLDCPTDRPETFIVDLTTGRVETPFPAGTRIREVNDRTKVATLFRREGDTLRAIVWDLRAGRELASFKRDGWNCHSINLLSDGRRAIIHLGRGRPFNEKVHSQHWLIGPGLEPRLLMDADGFLSSHVMSCPIDAELYSYDHWPSPMTPVDQAIRLRTLDGRRDEVMPMRPETMRPGDTWGARDHYLWTPDAKWIVSYFCPVPIQPWHDAGKPFNHFAWEWWLSATDWRTGEDLAARYSEGRWGCHMGVSPDSKWILCCGGPGFDKLFVVSIEGLRRGWNERVLCGYPKTVSPGLNSDPFPMPFALPDQSGVIFNAGWPGAEHGVYLCEWPKELA